MQNEPSNAAAALGALLAPIAVDEIPTLLRDRLPKLVRGQGPRPLPGWSELRPALAQGTIPKHHLRLVRHGARVADMFYSGPEGIRMERLDQLLERGCSLILEDLDRDLEPLRALADGLRALLGEHVVAGAIVTTGTRGALDLHYDNEDIIALQVEGTKAWQLHAPTMANVLKDGPRAPLPEGPPLLEVELRPGDMLFVPAGYWHQCTNRSGRSVHYSALIIPLSVTDVLTALLQRLLADEDWRRPLGRGGGGEDADEAALKAHLGTLIAGLSIPELRRAQLARGRPSDGASAD